MYLRLFKKLGLCKQGLRSSEGRHLLAFDDSSTRPCEELYLLVSFDEGGNKRIVNLHFLVVPCENVYNDIL